MLKKAQEKKLEVAEKLRWKQEVIKIIKQDKKRKNQRDNESKG